MRAFYENRKSKQNAPIAVLNLHNFNFLAHWHTEIEIAYVCKGSVSVGINQEKRILTQGEMMICGSNDIHYYHCVDETANVMLVIIEPSFIQDAGWNKPFSLPSFFLQKHQGMGDVRWENFLEEIFLKMLAEKDKDQYSIMFLKCNMMALIATILRHIPSYAQNVRNGDSDYKASEIEPMQEVLKFLEKEYRQDITLESLTKVANLSKFYFSRLFKKTTGITFVEYLNRIRIDSAEKMLENSEKPIIDIAFENGFNSVRIFNRVFKAVKGCTPISIRNRERGM